MPGLDGLFPGLDSESPDREGGQFWVLCGGKLGDRWVVGPQSALDDLGDELQGNRALVLGAGSFVLPREAELVDGDQERPSYRQMGVEVVLKEGDLKAPGSLLQIAFEQLHDRGGRSYGLDDARDLLDAALLPTLEHLETE